MQKKGPKHESGNEEQKEGWKHERMRMDGKRMNEK